MALYNITVQSSESVFQRILCLGPRGLRSFLLARFGTGASSFCRSLGTRATRRIGSCNSSSRRPGARRISLGLDAPAPICGCRPASASLEGPGRGLRPRRDLVCPK